MAKMAAPGAPLLSGVLHPEALRKGPLPGPPCPVSVLHRPQDSLHGDQCGETMGGRSVINPGHLFQ